MGEKQEEGSKWRKGGRVPIRGRARWSQSAEKKRGMHWKVKGRRGVMKLETFCVMRMEQVDRV